MSASAPSGRAGPQTWPRRAWSLLAHHGLAARAHHEVAMLVSGAVLEGDDAPLRTRARLALVHHLRLRVDRVAVEDGLGEFDLLEPEVAHGGPEGRFPDRQAHGDAQRQQAIDEGFAELRLGGGVEVDVQGLRVQGEAREEDVVRLGDRPSRLVPEGLANLQLVVTLARHDVCLALARGSPAYLLCRGLTSLPVSEATVPRPPAVARIGRQGRSRSPALPG